jgi:hypothetical protein
MQQDEGKTALITSAGLYVKYFVTRREIRVKGLRSF